MYLIVGETHPNVRKEEGEEYRNFLEKKVKKQFRNYWCKTAKTI